MEKFYDSIKTIILAFVQVVVFSFIFATPIFWFWSPMIKVLTFLPSDVPYMGIVITIFTLQTIARTIRTMIPTR